MKGWKHITYEQRKIINSCLSKNFKLCEIAELLQMDPTSISKEIKRNRTLTYRTNHFENKMCRKVLKYPFVCNGCPYRYTTCEMSKYRYEATAADSKAKGILKEKRRGLNLDEKTFKRIDELLIIGHKNKESIYQTVISHKDEIPLSVPTIYRYISTGIMTIKKIDLPYAVTYKKRKKSIKEYAYKNNNIDRNDRNYVNFLVYKRKHPGEFITEMDFLGAIKSDKKSILVITIRELHFPILYIIENKSQDKIKDFFDMLEKRLGDSFSTVFTCILTDRDPCFANYQKIEMSCFDDSILRTRLFFCDAFTSSQKSSVENINHQLRKYFPKGESIDNFTQKEIEEINLLILNSCLASLGGSTPKEAFIAVFGKTIFEKLF